MSNDQEFIRAKLDEWKLSKWYDRFIGKYNIYFYLYLSILKYAFSLKSVVEQRL